MGATARTEEADAVRLVEVALRYADHGWPVVPLHTPQDGSCSCRGDDCTSRGKHPRTARGLFDASTDAEVGVSAPTRTYECDPPRYL